MALSSNLVWELRTTGNDANGGAFRVGASGTDYSQQDAPQVTYTNLTIGSNNLELTSVANPFTSAHVGNVIKITSGTGFLAGRYEVMSVAGGVATMDRAVGTASSTGGVGRLGGCLATAVEAIPALVASNALWVRSGDYAISSSSGSTAASVTPSETVQATSITGYHVTRGDITPWTNNQANRPRLLCNGFSPVYLNSSGWRVSNLVVATGSSTAANGFYGNNSMRFINCKVDGFTSYGFRVQSGSFFMCEATGGQSGAVAAIAVTVGAGTTVACHVHDNACPGIRFTSTATAYACIVANNTGAGNHGIYGASTLQVINCTIHGNGGDGVHCASQGYTNVFVLGNILSENIGYGVVGSATAGVVAAAQWDGNAYYNNTLGNRQNLNDTTVNPIAGVAPYATSRDVILSASPFTDKTAKDWTLNNISGGGAACRGVGVPASLPGLASAGYPDFGAITQQRSNSEVIIPFMGF